MLWLTSGSTRQFITWNMWKSEASLTFSNDVIFCAHKLKKKWGESYWGLYFIQGVGSTPVSNPHHTNQAKSIFIHHSRPLKWGKPASTKARKNCLVHLWEIHICNHKHQGQVISVIFCHTLWTMPFTWPHFKLPTSFLNLKDIHLRIHISVVRGQILI